MLREVRRVGYEDESSVVDLHYPISRVISLFKGQWNAVLENWNEETQSSHQYCNIFMQVDPFNLILFVLSLLCM